MIKELFTLSNITLPFVEEYIRGILPSNEGLFREMELYADENHVPIVHKEVGVLLQVITKSIRATKVLEVGTAIAYSTLLFCEAMGDNGHITTIERNAKRICLARENIKKANKTNNIHLLEGDATEILKSLEGKYDLIFLDGAKGHYKDFLNDCINLLNPGGLLISDNILYKGMVATDELVVRRQRTIVNRMREYLQYICNHPQLDTSIIPIGDGLAISYKK
ncbi:O-methyltransferase [Alkaliphilus sp. B6464]|nr:O-methyltransferase [Alkaliphilus sp. B6464]